MLTKALSKPAPVAVPVLPSSPPVPTVTTPMTFAPSAELGDQLQRLSEAQAQIDHRKAEELARLREIQDRD